MSKNLSVEQPLLGYIKKMIEQVHGSKVLYLDKITTGIIAQLLTQSQALEYNVFLMQQLGIEIKNNKNKRNNIAHLRAVVFVRPTDENVQYLINHLKDPKHEYYHIFFSNTLDDEQLRRLAHADVYEVVSCIQEYYCDVYPINDDLWTLNKNNSLCYYEEQKLWNNEINNNLDREISGITSYLLATKKRPLIRYTQSSVIAKKMGLGIQDIIEAENELFGWSEPNTPPLLLILDRKEDPITPLLSQWTYQSMVHELLTINNSRVKLMNDNNKELVINPFDDKFFRININATFGEIGTRIRDAVNEYTKNTRQNKQLLKGSTIQDMQIIMEKYPELISKQGNVTKHVDITTSLSKIVNKRKLLDISTIEQEMVSNYDPKKHYTDLERTITNNFITDYDKIRLCIIFAVRYENKKLDYVASLRDLLRNNIKNEEYKAYIELINIFLRYFNVDSRKGKLFGDEAADKDLIKKLHMFVKGGIKGIENVYTQHKPLLYTIIDQAIKCKLSLDQFGTVNHIHKRQPKDIIIYIIGGATYEEALTVNKYNNTINDVNIVLGSSIIHNSQSFLNDVLNVYGRNINSSVPLTSKY